MVQNVKPFLLQQLRHALQKGAEEVRFISGQQPSISVCGALRPVADVTVSVEMIQALHRVCAVEAALADPELKQESYTVRLPEVGEFLCQFKIQGNTNAFLLFPRSKAPAVENRRQRVNPPLSGESSDDS